MVVEVLVGLVKGVIAGMGYAITGYSKAYKRGKQEEFDLSKFTATAILGALVGAVAGYMGMPIETAYDYVLTAGLIGVIENILKAIGRRLE